MILYVQHDSDGNQLLHRCELPRQRLGVLQAMCHKTARVLGKKVLGKADVSTQSLVNCNCYGVYGHRFVYREKSM